MQFIIKTYTLHGGLIRHILTPVEIYNNIVAAHDNKGLEVTFGNGSGYSVLHDIFLIAADLKENEIIYIPTKFGVNKYKKAFDNFSFYDGIFFANYCATQSTLKQISSLKQMRYYDKKIENREAIGAVRHIEHWKTKNILTVKRFKKDIYITTNADGFHYLAYGAKSMVEYGDDEFYNECSSHCHYDWKENTSKSIGITMFYWHNS